MRVVQPILRSSECDCDIESYMITMDEFGIDRFECPLHGPPFVVDKIEFDSVHDFMDWKAKQELSDER